jgi:hypothetical protein
MNEKLVATLVLARRILHTPGHVCSTTSVMPRNRSALTTLICSLVLAASSAPLLAQNQEQSVAAPPPATPPQQDIEQQEDDGFFGLGWLDKTQAASSNQANALARRIDRYFGVERSDLEAAYSSLRLITQTSWDHAAGSDFRVSLRGTVHLPLLSERLRLVFSDDRGEGTTYYNQNNVLTQQQTSTRANLELNLGESDYSRFDFRVGLRSNLKLRSSVRWRYERPFAENYVTRLSQTLYFIDSTGYGSFTQLQFDRILTEDTLLRWSSEFRAQEELPGNEWASALEYTVLGENSGGISYFLRLTGNSAHPNVDTYQVGFRLRQNILRPWLFWELTPGYSWVKRVPEKPEDPWQPYETGLFAAVRLEMAIGRY